MLGEPVADERLLNPGIENRRLFAPEEVGWLCNEARILRTMAGHEVWIDDPELGARAFLRLAYHPRLSSAVEATSGRAVGVESTTMLFARRGITTPAVPWWTAFDLASASRGPLAIVFLADAELSVEAAIGTTLQRVQRSAGDVAILPSRGGRMWVETDACVAPLFLVRFGNGSVRSHNGRPVVIPKLADDCLWQPAHWTAG